MFGFFFLDAIGQVLFQAYVGASYHGDIAMDDITIYQGQCAGVYEIIRFYPTVVSLIQVPNMLFQSSLNFAK